jgi:hypothetical protein
MSTEEPTNSGKIEDLRDQIFLPFIAPPLFFILDRKASTKAPFQRDLELQTIHTIQYSTSIQAMQEVD